MKNGAIKSTGDYGRESVSSSKVSGVGFQVSGNRFKILWYIIEIVIHGHELSCGSLRSLSLLVML